MSYSYQLFRYRFQKGTLEWLESKSLLSSYWESMTSSFLFLFLSFASNHFIRYSLPPSTLPPNHPLVRHEASLYEEARTIMQSFTTHRSQEFNKHILPLCNDLLRASGFRMAYEYAIAAGIEQPILDMFCSLAYLDVCLFIIFLPYMFYT